VRPVKHRLASLTVLVALAAGIPVFLAPAQAAFPGGDGRIAFQRFDRAAHGYVLYTANPDLTREIRVTRAPVAFSSSWSADGQHLVYDFSTADGNEQIATVNPDGTGRKELTSGPGIHDSPSFSPDGEQIVYHYSPLLPDKPGFSTSLWVMNADGSAPRQLVPGWHSFDTEPKLSPDGRLLAFVRLRQVAGKQQNALFVAHTDGTGPRQLTGWRLSVEAPDWSPDSRWLAYNTHAEDGGHPSVFVIRRDGSHTREVYAGDERVGGAVPVFSPDGTKLMFACIRFRPALAIGLCTVNVDGSGLVGLTKTARVRESRPAWGTAPLR
jgi:TolB protein